MFAENCARGMRLSSWKRCSGRMWIKRPAGPGSCRRGADLLGKTPAATANSKDARLESEAAATEATQIQKKNQGRHSGDWRSLGGKGDGNGKIKCEDANQEIGVPGKGKFNGGAKFKSAEPARRRRYETAATA